MCTDYILGLKLWDEAAGGRAWGTDQAGVWKGRERGLRQGV